MNLGNSSTDKSFTPHSKGRLCPQMSNLYEYFKIGLKDWVKANIAIKPKSKFPALGRAGKQSLSPSQPTEPTRNLIPNYFQQLVRNDLDNRELIHKNISSKKQYI